MRGNQIDNYSEEDKEFFQDLDPPDAHIEVKEENKLVDAQITSSNQKTLER